MGEREYTEVCAFLQRFIERCKGIKAAEGLCLTGIVLLLFLALGLGVEQLKGMLPYAPVVFSALFLGSLAFVCGLTLLRYLRPYTREWAARLIEGRHKNLKNNLINSLQLYPQLTAPNDRQAISTPMVVALLRLTRRQIQEIRINDLLKTDRLKGYLKLLGALAAPVLAVTLWHPSSLSRTVDLILHPLKDLPPAETYIRVTTKDLRVIRGSKVRIEAATSGARPDSVHLEVRSKELLDGERPIQHLDMEETEAWKYAADLREVNDDVEYRVTTGPYASPWYTIAAVDRPAISDLKMTLYPPHYTGLPNETVLGGNLRAVKGSTLHLQAETNAEMAKATIFLDDGQEIPLKITERHLQGRIVLFRSQQYQIRIEDSFGFKNLPVPYEMRAIPDGFPTVELLKPGEDLEVNGDETLTLEYAARDDFGIQEMTLVAKIGDREERLAVWREDVTRTVRDRHSWDLGAMGLLEGDVVVYHLEVLDNDTISGPKIGKSRPFTLRLKNLKAEHRQVAGMIRDLSDKMVDLLGEHLETSPTERTEPAPNPEQRPLSEGLQEMVERIDEVMQRARVDRLSDFATWADLEALKRNLQFTKDELLPRQAQASSPEAEAKAHDDISGELERMSLLSEDIGKRLTARDLASTAQDLLKSQERVLDSLEKLRSGNKELDAVMKELSRLSQQLRELQSALSKFARQMPDDFINRQSMRNLQFNDMQSALEQIRKKLREGDIEGALQMARELFNQMAQMVASLRRGQQQAQSSMMGRARGAMMRSSNELQRILQEQQEILLQTEATEKELALRRSQLLAEELRAFEDHAKASLNELAIPQRSGVDEEEEASGEDSPEDSLGPILSELMASLKDRQFDTFSQALETALNRLQELEQGSTTAPFQLTREVLEQLAARLEEMGQLPVTDELTASQTRELRELSQREGALKEKTQDLHRRLNNLFQLFPSLDPKILQNIGEAGGFMDSARTELAGLSAKQAIPPEQEAIKRLSDSNQQMQSAMQQLAQRGQLGNVPLVYLFRQGRFMPSGRLIPMPGTPKFPDFDMDEGLTGLDTERFKLPGKDDYKPQKFREEILESLKQGVPDSYKEQVEAYFKELSQ